MAAGAWLSVNTTKAGMLNGEYNVHDDTFKMALFLSTSNIGAASTTFAGLTNEHAAAYGYTAGGESVDLVVSVIDTDDAKIDIATDPVWTASGGSITAKWSVVYKVGGNVLFYSLLEAGGADVTATDGNTLTCAGHASGVGKIA